MTLCAKRWVSLAALLWLSACSFFTPSDHFGSKPILFDALNDWPLDDHAAALAAFMRTCPVLAQKPQAETRGSGLSIPATVWQSLCVEASQISANDDRQAKDFFERRFVPYRLTNNDREKGLFTGYYEPVLYGSLHKGGDFIYPLYAAPPELAREKPYYTRQQIEAGALKGRRLEIVWVDDPVMLFFLHIQGSGIIHLSNGKSLHVGYADQNGQKYASLGKLMEDQGLLAKDDINFFTLREWLYRHPDQAVAMMQQNPSYIFFKKLDSPWAIGAAGGPLTPERSLAVDSRYIPYGLPLYLETDLPPKLQEKSQPFHRLVIAQDTGGAIKGPVRGDIFFGRDDDAEYLAGYMKGKGVYTLFVPKEITPELVP